MTPTDQAIDSSVAFLRRWCGQSARVITALHPDRGYIRTRGFGPGDDEALRAFIVEWRGSRNLYFQVNRDQRPLSEIRSKSRKEHIGSVVALHVDVDSYKDGEATRAHVLEQLTATLPEGIPGPPSLIINSGNGLQAFWRLREPVQIDGDIARAEAVERFNRGIAVAYRGDRTTDVTRVMRLPGSINWPNERKRGMGLVPAPARLVSIDTTLLYELSQFPAIAGQGPRPTTLHNQGLAGRLQIGEAVGVADIDDLRVPDHTKALIALGAAPDDYRDGRSEYLFSAICSLIRCGEPDEVVLGVITDDRWRISDSVLDKPNPEQHARHQIRRAHAWLSSQLENDFRD